MLLLHSACMFAYHTVFSILLVAEPFLFLFFGLFVCLPVFRSFFFLFLFSVGGCPFSCPCHEFVCFSAEIRQEWGQLCSAAHVQSHTDLVSWYSMLQNFSFPFTYVKQRAPQESMHYSGLCWAPLLWYLPTAIASGVVLDLD